jgi:SPP1 family predicted phage head-tail adaptor
MINFGKYDQKIDFISFSNVSDGYGGTEPTETLVLSTFASVRQLRANDGIEASQMVFPVAYQVMVQVREGFTPTVAMMVKYRNQKYKIAGVIKRIERMSQEWVMTIIQA